MSVINFLINYWYVFVVVIAVIIGITYKIKTFYKLPDSEKVKQIKSFLYTQVVEISQKYDEGLYDVIINSVYEQFTVKFPIVKAFIPADTVKEWIKNALDDLTKLLASQGKTFASLGHYTTLK